MRTALLLGARYAYPYVRRKVVRGVKGLLGSGTFVGKKNLDLFRPVFKPPRVKSSMSMSGFSKGPVGSGGVYTVRGRFRGGTKTKR